MRCVDIYGVSVQITKNGRVISFLTWESGDPSQILGLMPQYATAGADKQIAAAPAIPDSAAMEQSIAAFQVALELEGKADRLVKQAVSAIRRASVQHVWKHPRDITMAALHEHLAVMQKKGRDPKTRNNFVYFLRAFCKAAKALGLIETNPITSEAPFARVTKKDARIVPTQDQVIALIRAARKDWRKKDRWLVYLAAATTGMRWRTCRLLEWPHLNLDDSLPHLKMPATILKSKDPRVVFLTTELVGALRERKAASMALGKRARVIEGKTVYGFWVFEAVPKWDNWCRDCAAAGIDRGEKGGPTFSFHSLRHFASNLNRLRGLTDEQRAFQNTHASTAMTSEVYTNPEWIELGRKVLQMPGLLSQSEGGPHHGVKKSGGKPFERLTNEAKITDTSRSHYEHAFPKPAHTDADEPAEAHRWHSESRRAVRDEVCDEGSGWGALEGMSGRYGVTGSSPVAPISAPRSPFEVAAECQRLALSLMSIASHLLREVANVERSGRAKHQSDHPSP